MASAHFRDDEDPTSDLGVGTQTDLEEARTGLGLNSTCDLASHNSDNDGDDLEYKYGTKETQETLHESQTPVARNLGKVGFNDDDFVKAVTPTSPVT